jgi:hypothetical protein
MNGAGMIAIQPNREYSIVDYVDESITFSDANPKDTRSLGHERLPAQ